MCYLAKNEKLIFSKLNPNSVLKRCRTNSNENPLLKVPHVTVAAEVKRGHFCLGKRKFEKQVKCNISSGKKWSTACVMSILTGGLGGDRFYLNYWRSAIGRVKSN